MHLLVQLGREYALNKYYTLNNRVHLITRVYDIPVVRSKIKSLEKQFSSLQRQLSSELNANSEVSPAVLLLESLTLLPDQLQLEYHRLVLKNLSTLKSAENIFNFLSLHISFIDYHLIKYHIEKFGSVQLQEDMSAYIKLVQVFYDETTVQQLMDHWPGRGDIPPNFEELRVVINEDPGTYVLQRLDNLQKEFCSEIRLFETVLILKRFVKKNNLFVICWVVPSMCVLQLKSVISSLGSFCQKEHISSVTVGIAVRDSNLTSCWSLFNLFPFIYRLSVKRSCCCCVLVELVISVSSRIS